MSRPGLLGTVGSLDRDPRAHGRAVKRALLGLGDDDESLPDAADRLLGERGSLESSWRLGASIDARALAFPCVLEIQLIDPTDLLDTEKLGVLWDGSIRENGPMVVREGSVVFVPISARRGDVLNIMTTDDIVGNVIPRTVAEAEERKKTVAEEQKRGIFDAFGDLVLGAQKTVQSVFGSAAIIVVAAAGVYLVSKLYKK